MARRRRARNYVNPRAPKNIDDGPRKKFKVAAGASIHVKDEDGVVRKYSARQEALNAITEDRDEEEIYVMLTEGQATYLGNLGYIDIELDFGTEADAELKRNAATIEALQRRIAELENAGELSGEETPDDAAISALIQGGSDSPAATDADENGAGDNADSGGTEPSSGPSSGRELEASVSSSGRRRKAL